MKKTQVFFASLSIFVCLIVLPVIRSVNGSAGNYGALTPSLVAEGNPMPAPIPPASHVSILVAEGNPMPPPIPPNPHFFGLTTIA